MSVALNTKWFNTFDSLTFRFVLKTNALFVWRVLLFVLFLCVLPSRPRLWHFLVLIHHQLSFVVKFWDWIMRKMRRMHSTCLKQWTFLQRTKRRKFHLHFFLWFVLLVEIDRRMNHWLMLNGLWSMWRATTVAPMNEQFKTFQRGQRENKTVF